MAKFDYNQTIANLSDFLHRISSIIISIGDNAAFVAVLTAYPQIPAKWLIFAHLIFFTAKSYYYHDKVDVKIKDLPRSSKEEIIAKPIKISDLDDSIDIF